MLYIFGDLHGIDNINYRFSKMNFKEGPSLTKNDYVIILGDFGIPWFFEEHPNYIKELRSIAELSKRKWTTLFIDGNHENFINLKKLPTETRFGSEVGVLADDIYHLKRGKIYNIDGRNIFTFGGAHSIDKHDRIEGVSWWKEEETNYKETEEALQNLSVVSNNVDLVLTHTISRREASNLLGIPKYMLEKCSVSKFFDLLEKEISYKAWFYGHFHREHFNNRLNQFCLYETYCKVDLETMTYELKLPYGEFTKTQNEEFIEFERKVLY